jgi:hypothetical protein
MTRPDSPVHGAAPTGHTAQPTFPALGSATRAEGRISPEARRSREEQAGTSYLLFEIDVASARVAGHP